MGRTALWCLALLLAQGCAGPSASRQAERWNPNLLHPEVASRIHLHASGVPSFPNDDPALRNPRRWPRRMKIQGRRLVLNIHGARPGRSAMLPASIDDIDGLSPFTLFYTREGSKSREEWGPTYMWTSPHRLVHRTWTESKGRFRSRHEYGYHENGELFRYGISRSRTDPRMSIRLERFTEFFDRRGRLMGASYTRQDANGKTTEVHYKDGKRIAYPAFEREPAVGEGEP